MLMEKLLFNRYWNSKNEFYRLYKLRLKQTTKEQVSQINTKPIK